MSYARRHTQEVCIGGIFMGGVHPIRVQSMTTTDTMDTAGTIAQVLSLHAQGSAYVRLTVPNILAARHLEEIKKGLKAQNCLVPLIADVHFTPRVAEEAARRVEKVRINPGNYVDSKRFVHTDYDEASYGDILSRLASRLRPLLSICREYGTALRIGTNHGSLSDRIMSRYGDTPEGMVESALEFVRICESEGFYDIVLSMKASHPQVMMSATRLLVFRLQEESLRPYPLHLGVTEAGDGLDGRMKSAVGIGGLLMEGVGDTVRVSLTEAPERELPVARSLIEIGKNQAAKAVLGAVHIKYERRVTERVAGMGFKANTPSLLPFPVLVDITSLLSRSMSAAFLKDLWDSLGYVREKGVWRRKEFACDMVYTGSFEGLSLPTGVRAVVDAKKWKRSPDLPYFGIKEALSYSSKGSILSACVRVDEKDLDDKDGRQFLKNKPFILLGEGSFYSAQKDFIHRLQKYAFSHPIWLPISADGGSDSALRMGVWAGALLSEGYGDGLWLGPAQDTEILRRLLREAFALLQATRLRMSTTEYIACPSCGRTLFDLEETTARIRRATRHLKGLKIGIMGCIVNGPGEMADADYGYVGSGRGKVTLYRGKEVVERGIPSQGAVSALLALIKKDGQWKAPAGEVGV